MRPGFLPLEETLDCDVVVVGGGYTGLSAALELAGRGYSVALLEGDRIASAASGRNGGHICSGFNPGVRELTGWIGADDTRRLWQMAEESKALVRQRVEDYAIDCDLKWGYLFPAPKARQMGVLAAELASWNTLGYRQASMVPRAEMHRHVQSDAYAGALYDAGGGHLHPLNYALGLADAAVAAGVKIFEQSRVTQLLPGSRPSAITAAGRVIARHMVVACNADIGNLSRKLGRRIMRAGTYMLATAPMGEARAKALLPADIAVADVNFVLNYYRLSFDHRLLFGGGISYSGFDRPDLRSKLRSVMLKYLPQLHDLSIDYLWGGHVALTQNRMPEFGRLAPNTYFAHGYSGHGVALSGLAGKLIAEAVAGSAERFDLFQKIPHRDWPGGQLLRKPALLLGTAWYRLRDRL